MVPKQSRPVPGSSPASRTTVTSANAADVLQLHLARPEEARARQAQQSHRLVDPRDGTKRLVVFSGLHPIRRAYSDDDGATWSPLEPIGDFGGIVAMSSVVALADARSFEAVLALRVEQLGPPARALLEVVAVAAEPIDPRPHPGLNRMPHTDT